MTRDMVMVVEGYAHFPVKLSRSFITFKVTQHKDSKIKRTEHEVSGERLDSRLGDCLCTSKSLLSSLNFGEVALVAPAKHVW